jgi:hypothetical protein
LGISGCWGYPVGDIESLRLGISGWMMR